MATAKDKVKEVKEKGKMQLMEEAMGVRSEILDLIMNNELPGRDAKKLSANVKEKLRKANLI